MSGEDKYAAGKSSVGCVPYTSFRLHLWWKNRQWIWSGVFSMSSVIELVFRRPQFKHCILTMQVLYVTPTDWWWSCINCFAASDDVICQQVVHEEEFRSVALARWQRWWHERQTHSDARRNSVCWLNVHGCIFVRSFYVETTPSRLCWTHFSLHAIQAHSAWPSLWVGAIITSQLWLMKKWWSLHNRSSCYVNCWHTDLSSLLDLLMALL